MERVRVRVGVVGLGEVAQIVHLPILQALADRYEIAALCDVSPGLLAAMGERYGVPPERRYADAHELAAQPDLGAVFVLNSDEYHAEHAIAAIRHGKHVLVEKPMCLSEREAVEIVAARDAAGVQVMVAYMRRFAPAFTEAVAAVRALPKINYARVRDIIGANRLIIEQSSAVLRFDDVPAPLGEERAERARRLVAEAIGDAPPEIVSAYRLLLGLGSHDLSAMRELIGRPQRVASARQWNGGRFIAAILEFDGYFATYETGVDQQRRFDAHLEVYGDTASVRVQYDTPYIRHLPTTLVTQETRGEAFVETVTRPTFKDPYTHELETFHEVATGKAAPKTTPEDFVEDLQLFAEIVAALRAA
ncbi:MAG: Myo-inositol 2-dehydrogenase [uncultured Thermomicrobiales bacterium]|uniref:Myo-inositol 2-dehydrogenase n=1 Tax=uncultured Thermomicrobiales bacterium TaxID=1645740 RepID=A0A6J4VLM2_9BACT|nr:MAG: Myo-inositol 2-dehydrogenase [uncultured Thermomicrobiales bacterium]